MYNELMKLVIQIPAYNEETTISTVLEALPKKLNNISEIYTLVINDGSNDKTYEIAKKYCNEVINLEQNKGLANAFMVGLNRAIELSADILVNIDADNQYCADDIEKLISPIIQNKADISIGSRPIDKIKEFSFLKKLLQKFGSFVVKNISGINVKDAPSGFRAYSKEAILKMNIFSNFSYTIESLLQAKDKNLSVINVDISLNSQTQRKSRLFKNIFDYIFKQAKTLLRFWVIYSPAKFFAKIACMFLFFGLLIGIRFLYYFFFVTGVGHIQSLILCAIFLIISFMLYMLAVLGDLFSINRKILEDIQYELRKQKCKK